MGRTGLGSGQLERHLDFTFETKGVTRRQTLSLLIGPHDALQAAGTPASVGRCRSPDFTLLLAAQRVLVNSAGHIVPRAGGRAWPGCTTVSSPGVSVSNLASSMYRHLCLPSRSLLLLPRFPEETHPADPRSCRGRCSPVFHSDSRQGASEKAFWHCLCFCSDLRLWRRR